MSPNHLTQLPRRGFIEANRLLRGAPGDAQPERAGASSARQTVATLMCSPGGRHPSALRFAPLLQQGGEVHAPGVD